MYIEPKMKKTGTWYTEMSFVIGNDILQAFLDYCKAEQHLPDRALRYALVEYLEKRKNEKEREEKK